MKSKPMQKSPFKPTRRAFLRVSASAIAGASLVSRGTANEAPPPKLFSAMGLAAPMSRAAVLKAAGAEFLTENTSGFLMPDQSDEAFAKSLEKLAASALPVLACNGFIRPKHLRCVGAEANHEQVLEWAEVCFRRLKQAGGKFIIFGSSGARALRDSWPKEKADPQFISLLKRMGPLAEKHGVMVVLEQLQKQECNYINRIGEAAAMIREAGHPSVRLLADLYHMARGGDTPADLEAAMDVVVHIEIAEKKDRSVPGVRGDDFRPYFRVLREAGYHGAISIEGRGDDEQIGRAFKEIARQAGEV